MCLTVNYLDSSSYVSWWIISIVRRVSHGELFRYFVRLLTVHNWNILSRITMNFLDIFWGVSPLVTSIFCRAFHGKLYRYFFRCLTVNDPMFYRVSHSKLNLYFIGRLTTNLMVLFYCMYEYTLVIKRQSFWTNNSRDMLAAIFFFFFSEVD